MFGLKLPPKVHPQKNHLAKFPLSGDSLFFASLVADQKCPLLYIVNDGYQLQRLYNELTLFAPNLNIGIFPGYEVLPYERQSPYNQLIAERLRILWRIKHRQLDILLVQAATLQTLLPPEEYFIWRVLLVKCGDKLDSEELRSQLVTAGYQCVAQVYEAGEFAIRGSIIDILPMGSKKAIRIDLFDDEVETINYFDSKSQIVQESVDSIELLPSREYPHDPASLKQMATNFVNRFPKEAQSNLAKDLTSSILPTGIEFYLPLFFDNCASLFDYLTDSWQVVYSADLLSQLNLNWQEINKRYDYYSYQYPCLKPSELFFTPEFIFARLKQLRVWEIATTGEYYPEFTDLSDVAVENKVLNPYHKLSKLSKNKQIIFCAASLGRLEILRQTLFQHQLFCKMINSWNELLDEPLTIIQADLYQGFSYGKYLFITEADLYPRTIQRKIRSRIATKGSVNNDLMVRDLAEIGKTI